MNQLINLKYFSRKKDNEWRLKSVLEIAEKLYSISQLKRLKRILTNAVMGRLTSELVSKCYEYKISKRKLGYVDDLNEICRDLAFFLGEGYGKISYSKINNREIAVALKEDPIILRAWNYERLIRCLGFIGEDIITEKLMFDDEDGIIKYYKKEVPNYYVHDKLNHYANIIEPIGITILYNGNHSTLTGILKGEGILYPREVVDISQLYDNIYFDGNYYRD